MSRRRHFLTVLLALFLGALLGGPIGIWLKERRGGVASEALVSIAMDAMDKNRMDEVAPYAFDALTRDVGNHAPYLVLGELYARRGERSAALDAFRRSLQVLRENRGHQYATRLDGMMREREAAIIEKRIEALAEKRQPASAQ